MTIITEQISLDQLPLGQLAEVVRIGGEKATRRRLLDLGVLPGADLRVLQSAGGPLLIAVRDSRLAIGQGMAHKVLVKVKEQR